MAIRPRYGLVIGGEEREPRDGGELATIEPATGDHLAVVAEAGAPPTSTPPSPPPGAPTRALARHARPARARSTSSGWRA